MTEAERNWNRILGARVLAEVKKRGETLVELSRKSRVPYSSLHAYVAKGQRMSVWTLARICTALEIAPAVLLGGAL
jgi:lambda repressor-like predicted transcriptional regulator